MLIGTKNIAEKERLTLYANLLASRRVYFWLMKKLADVGVPVRESVLVHSVANSNKVFTKNLVDYAETTVTLAATGLGNDKYLTIKTTYSKNNVMIEITDFGLQAVKLAEKLMEVV